MKNLSLFSLLIMIGLVLFMGGCSKESEAYSEHNNDTNTTLINSFSNGTEVTTCNENNPNNPEYRIKVSEAQKKMLQNIFIALDNSENFEITPDIIEDFGNPITKMALLYNKDGITNVILPFYKKSSDKITSFFVINRSTSGIFTYNFINRQFHIHYQSDITLPYRPSSTIMAINQYYFELFDYGVCNSNSVPSLPNGEGGINATPLCEQEQMVGVYDDCNSWAIIQNQTEFREPCLVNWHDETVTVPCPQGSGGLNGGDSGSGWNGSGPGTYNNNNNNNNNGNGNNQNPKMSVYLERLRYLENWMSTNAIDNLYNFILTTDMSDDCVSYAKAFINILEDNNFSQAAISTANCLSSNMGVNVHPSAPDDCSIGTQTGIPNIINNMANMPSLAYSIGAMSSSLASLPCRLANSQLSSSQVNNLLAALHNYIPGDAPVMEDIDGNPILNGPTGPNYHAIANLLTNVLRSFPQLDFSQAEMEWLLNNSVDLDLMKTYLFQSKNNNTLPKAFQVVEFFISNQPKTLEVAKDQIENWYYDNVDSGLEYTVQGGFDWSKHSPVTLKSLPSYSAFYGAYPKDDDNKLLTGAKTIFGLLNGEIKAVYDQSVLINKPIQNVCALKVSIALNGAGITIPHIFQDNNSNGIQEFGEVDFTIPDNNGKYYFLNAELLINYMLEVFPTPTLVTLSGEDIQNGANPESRFGTNSGIYGMLPIDPDSFDATGHCDIWLPVPGESYNECGAACYWEYVNIAYLWKLN
jgi:Type VI secretion system (T6SS), amidase effector protein 4